MTQQEQPQQVHQFEFLGSAGEYFKIWMANTILSILTLGIYSAWAKVRTRKYLYGSTYLEGANFDYTASPLAILFGRVLIVILLLGGGLWAGEDLLRGAAHTMLLVLLLPWALVRSFAFNARYTSYRNVKFAFIRNKQVYLGFYLAFAPLIVYMLVQYATFIALDLEDVVFEQTDGDAWGGGEWFAAALVAALAAFVLLLPPCMRALHRLKGSHMCWGEYQATFKPAGYAAYFAALLLAPLASFAGLSLTGGAVAAQMGGVDIGVAIILIVIASYVLVLAGFSLTRVMLFRLYWQGLGLPGGGCIKCNFSAWHFAVKIIIVNYIAIAASLGLLYPWAQVRKMKYLAAHTTLHMPAGALDEMLARASDKQHAIGEELEAADGFNLGIDIV